MTTHSKPIPPPTITKPHYIIAGSADEYNQYIILKGLNPLHYVYVTSTDSLRGLSSIHGLFIGTWRKRPDIEAIKAEINYIKKFESSIDYERQIQAAVKASMEDAAKRLSDEIDKEVLDSLTITNYNI